MAKVKKSNERPKGLLRATGVPTRDVDYRHWIGELKKRYRTTQIKAAIAVNSALIEFYWNLGRDISEKYPGKVRDAAFFQKLSADLRLAIPDASGLSVSNIKYARYFFELYSGIVYRQQLAADKTSQKTYRPRVADNNVNLAYRPQVVDDRDGCSCLPQVVAELGRVPWGHHRYIIDKCKGDREKHILNTPGDNPPIGLLVCKNHNRVLAKIHLEELALPIGITDYELKKVLPTQAQLAKCYADAEAKCAKNSATPQTASESDLTLCAAKKSRKK